MSTQKGRSLFLAIAFGVSSIAPLHAQQTTTVTGEVIETYCYAIHSVGGPGHAACGIECAKRGLPVGIVDAKTRKVIVLLAGRDKTSLPPELIAQMGRRVTIEGELVSRGGEQFLTVQKWEKAK